MWIVATALSLCGPLLAGWLLVQKVWPDVPPGFRAGLGAALGTGLAGTIYFLALLLFDSSRIALGLSECGLGAVIVILFFGRARRSTLEGPFEAGSTLYRRSAALAFAVTAALATGAFVFALDSGRHGGWDAFVVWNLRARLIATSQTSSLSTIFDPVFLGLHPDYPLLLPSLVSRGWQYSGSDTPAVPIALAVLFTIATISITVTGLRLISTKSQSWIAGCILLSTPFLLNLAASQYADIVICCFMTGAVVVYAIYDLDSAHRRLALPFLAGAAAAAAACTKNEGIAFLAVLLASRIAAALVRRTWAGSRKELLGFASGAAGGVLTLALFKLGHSPPNDTIQVMTVHGLLTRITDGKLHLEILKGIQSNLNFGQWRFNPIPLMAIHAAATWKRTSPAAKPAPWFTAAFVLVGMLSGYYIVYLLSPYDLESHVQSSLDRLLIQLWPSMVVLYSVMAAPRNPGESLSSTSRTVALRIAAVSVAIAAALAITFWPAGGKLPEITSASKPHIELNRTEVTAGDTYVIKITGIRGPQVYVSYSLDGKPLGQFGAYLGSDGSVDFQVSPSTPKGMYRFQSVRNADSPVWIGFDNDAAITVK